MKSMQGSRKCKYDICNVIFYENPIPDLRQIYARNYCVGKNMIV